jgi:hypothetical protein
LASFRVPIARFAGFADAVGTDVNRLLSRVFVDVVVGSKLKAGVLRIAVDSDASASRFQARRKLDKPPAENIVHGQLALFLGERIFLAVGVPADGDTVPAQHRPSVGREKGVVFLVGAIESATQSPRHRRRAGSSGRWRSRR